MSEISWVESLCFLSDAGNILGCRIGVMLMDTAHSMLGLLLVPRTFLPVCQAWTCKPPMLLCVCVSFLSFRV